MEKANDTDIETIDLLLNIYDFNKQFDKMAKKSEAYIDLFPTKANLYYYAGKGNNNLKNYKKAKDFLEMGIDYVLDDPNLETGFCKQFIICADGLSDTKLKQTYQKRLDILSKNNMKNSNTLKNIRTSIFYSFLEGVKNVSRINIYYFLY